MTIKRCDRCGKNILPKDYRTTSVLSGIKEIHYIKNGWFYKMMAKVEVEGRDFYYDFCDECTAEFEEWMGNAKAD